MKESQGIVFDIQRFSYHDGPGIRTVVFLKGCPLDCKWCHNPESKNKNPQVMYDSSVCENYLECIEVCMPKALYKDNNTLGYKGNACNGCGKCVEVCKSGALKMCGIKMGVGQVMEEVIKDKDFYEQSDGGITISGGEPTFQPEFCFEILKRAKEMGINTAIETCGFNNYNILENIMTQVDTVLYDFKMYSNELHKKWTGVDNDLIKDNLLKLKNKNYNIIVRIPIIPGVNMEEKELNNMFDFLVDNNFEKVTLIPYHQIWKTKYNQLGIEVQSCEFDAMDNTEFSLVKALAIKKGLRIID